MLIFLRSSYIFTSCTTCSTYLYYRIIVQVIGPPGARTSPPINWSDRLVHGLRRRPVDRSVRRSLLLNAHFDTDQLTILFVARASSPAMPVTPRRSDSLCSRTKWAHFTARTSPATLGTPRCSDLAAYAGYSSLLSARSAPATPGTPRSSVFEHRHLHWGLLGAQILLCLIGVLSSCSMLFRSGC